MVNDEGLDKTKYFDLLGSSFFAFENESHFNQFILNKGSEKENLNVITYASKTFIAIFLKNIWEVTIIHLKLVIRWGVKFLSWLTNPVLIMIQFFLVKNILLSLQGKIKEDTKKMQTM